MHLFLIGIDYRGASLKQREAAFRSRRAISDFWEDQQGLDVALLATCNRLEVYVQSESIIKSLQAVSRFRLQFRQEFLGSYLYIGTQAVFTHLLRLACGLESQLKGERQILSQLESWSTSVRIPLALSALLQHALAEASNIRGVAGLNSVDFTIAQAVAEDAKEYLGTLQGKEIVILGTGKVAGLFCQGDFGKSRLYFLSRRNIQRAQQFASQAGAGWGSWDELPRHLLSADLLVGATTSPHVVLRQAQIAPIIARRQSRLLMYDLAMPRDFDPAISKLPGVLLKDMGALAPEFEAAGQAIHRELAIAEYLCTERSSAYNKEYDESRIESGNKA